jgi:hypothetical protein
LVVADVVGDYDSSRVDHVDRMEQWAGKHDTAEGVEESKLPFQAEDAEKGTFDGVAVAS